MRRADALSYGALAFVLAGFAVYAAVDVSRLDNNLMGDVDRAGWIGPLASRAGRPYVDFVTTVPPGAILVLRLIQRAVGRVLLIEELALVQIVRGALGLLAWGIARPLVSRRTSLMVLVTTLAIVSQLQRECADEALAALCAWGSLATGVRAFLHTDEKARRRALIATGFLALLALAFETAMGVGTVIGWLVILAWTRRAPDARAWLAGALAGIIALGGLVLAIDGSIAGYARSVLADGWSLMDGASGVARWLAGVALVTPIVPASIVLTALALAVGLRIARIRGNLSLADPPDDDGRPAAAVAIALLGAGAFALATVLLDSGATQLPHTVAAVATACSLGPAFGLVLGLAFLAAVERLPAARAEAWRALIVVGLAATLAHSACYVAFQPLAQYGPAIPVAVLVLYMALERARLPSLASLVLVLSLVSIFGLRFDRALAAATPVGARGNWAGLRVGVRGTELLRAAHRVQSLAAPDQRVLVLQEDPELVGLLERPRPAIAGARVFAGEYPPRLADADARALDREPPRVIVILPRSRDTWSRLFELVGRGEGAARLVDHVREKLLPRRYRLDSSFRSLYFFDAGAIDVWVRVEDRR